jgi:hypothetical protein
VPNLPERYAHSIAKGEEVRGTAPAPFVAAPGVPCLGGCGEPMPVGQKCNDCATRAVEEWKARKHGFKKGK